LRKGQGADSIFLGQGVTNEEKGMAQIQQKVMYDKYEARVIGSDDLTFEKRVLPCTFQWSAGFNC